MVLALPTRSLFFYLLSHRWCGFTPLIRAYPSEPLHRQAELCSVSGSEIRRDVHEGMGTATSPLGVLTVVVIADK
jgi:hypothetical protein